MKQALVLGCSHITGKDLSTEPNIMLDMPAEEFERTQNFAAIIARELGYTVNNRAKNGSSNDRIFRIFVEQLNNLTADDVVIVAWTGRNRTEVNDQGVWHQICPGQIIKYLPDDVRNYAQAWTILENIDRSQSSLNKIKNILALNSLAASYNIPVINLDSFWPVDNFVWPKTIHWPVPVDFDTWCMERHYPTSPTRHFYSKAHRAYANYVLNTIKEA